MKKFIVFLIIAVIAFLSHMIFLQKVSMSDIVISKNPVSHITQNFSWYQKQGFLVYAKLHNAEIQKIKSGQHSLSGYYSFKDLVEELQKSPVAKGVRVTIREGRNIYDTDSYLVQKGLADEGEYIRKTTNMETAKKMTGRMTLEGYLYPDTYDVPISGAVDALIGIQYKTFQKKIDTTALQQTAEKISRDYGVNLSTYDLLILASVIDKEERNPENYPMIAGIFLNRLRDGRRLDADITLCYGLQTPYTQCTTKAIVENLSDTKNLYNTRANKGLPPTPISSPNNAVIEGLVNYQKNPYFFYLHAPDGTIYFAKDAAGHNENKRKYLK